MKGFTIYTANCTGNAKNCVYSTEVVVKDIASLKRAMQHDHVCAMYHDHKRSAAGFEWSDCIPMDCDNDHSEDTAQWKQPEDVARLAGMRFANTAEPGHGLLLDAALVKSMTGNDTLNARFLHEKKQFRFQATIQVVHQHQAIYAP